MHIQSPFNISALAGRRSILISATASSHSSEQPITGLQVCPVRSHSILTGRTGADLGGGEITLAGTRGDIATCPFGADGRRTRRVPRRPRFRHRSVAHHQIWGHVSVRPGTVCFPATACWRRLRMGRMSMCV
jgi:hypothetical protein